MKPTEENIEVGDALYYNNNFDIVLSKPFLENGIMYIDVHECWYTVKDHSRTSITLTYYTEGKEHNGYVLLKAKPHRGR